MTKEIFQCIICYRVFKLKHHLKAHLQRKKPCVLTKKSIVKNPQKCKNNPISVGSNTIQPSKKEAVIKSFTCDYCNYEFNRNWHLKRHLKTCKRKIDQDKTQKELEKAKMKIKELEQRYLNKIDTHSTTNNNTTNNNNNNKINTTTNNNCHNNTVNLIFNDYGNENIEALKNIKYKKLIAQILGNGMGGLQKYIKYKYCNPELPENLTIKYTNDRSDKLKIRKNNKWKTRDKNEVLDELYDRDTNIEEVLNVYEHINDLEDGEEMDELQEHFVDEIHKFYNDEDVDEGVDKEVEEEMKRIKKITLNDFYDCYKQNKVKFDLKNIS